ncbi:hypothetical protein ACLOJK_029836 [Asimina triloba]
MRAWEEEKRRLKREDCKHNKHDSLFSKWEESQSSDVGKHRFEPNQSLHRFDNRSDSDNIEVERGRVVPWSNLLRFQHISTPLHAELLIGPTDWEDYSRGKDGAGKYRLHNIPISCSCPGLYELGIAADHTDGSHKLRKYGSDRIVVVYLGQADNIRTRLQDYGRSGSHLDHGNPIAVAYENENLCLQRGPEIPSFHISITLLTFWLFQMKNKKTAEKTETQLLKVFDYAWNNCGNGIRRPEDILLKLDRTVSNATFMPDIVSKFQRWKWVVLGKKRVGIRIDNGLPFNEFKNTSDGRKSNSGSQVLKYSLSRPRIITKEPVVTCGVALGDGTVCSRRPIEGRKRCSEHKWKRINGRWVCLHGIPVLGGKRCGLHKGRRVTGSKLAMIPESGTGIASWQSWSN